MKISVRDKPNSVQWDQKTLV